MKAATARSTGSRPASLAVSSSSSLLKRGVRYHLVATSLTVLAVTVPILQLPEVSALAPLATHMVMTSLILWAGVCLVVWQNLSFHPHERFGPANSITLYRAAATVVFAGFIPAAAWLSPMSYWWLSLTAMFLLTLDGLDGYLARRSKLASAFGARFDMEVDALLTLILSVMLWQSGETGAWILALGFLRYAFVLGSFFVPALSAPLFPSFRRKLVCVIQLATLCALLTPMIEPPLSTLLGMAACLLLLFSFARDVHWLLYRQS